MRNVHSFRLPLRLLYGAALLMLLLACTGGNSGRDHAGQINQAFTISPVSATVVAGQSFQFRAVSPWGGTAVWSLPSPTDGTVSPGGLYTAPLTPGPHSLVAMWNGDIRYTATASITVLPAPTPRTSTPNSVMASGAQQGGGAFRNAAIAGEPVHAQHASGAGGLDLRHGFDPKTH